MFRLPNDVELNEELLAEFISAFREKVNNRYIPLMKLYMTEYPIFDNPPKAAYKPDKRIAVNFAKTMTDEMTGFFMGIPVKYDSPDERVSEYVSTLNAYNNVDDLNAELSKGCDIFGKHFEMYYVDEYGNIGIVKLSPKEAFMIYDDSILCRPRYFVRVYTDANNYIYCSVSDRNVVRYYDISNGCKFTGEESIHGFGYVPATEFIENDEHIGLYEPVRSMINEYNDAISEKANDVSYFADAYLKILGAKLMDNDLCHIRDDRIINFEGEDSSGLVVDFLQKPDGDTSQEHLLDRLERLIFQIAMCANISDDNFGTSSGIAMKYKLFAMSNMADTKQRKFTASMNNRYKVIFSNPVSKMLPDDWVKISYTFTKNIPANLLEESQIAGNLSGIVSKKTQLSTLSCVKNVDQEIAQIEQEEEDGITDGFPTNRTEVIEETTEVDNVTE